MNKNNITKKITDNHPYSHNFIGHCLWCLLIEVYITSFSNNDNLTIIELSCFFFIKLDILLIPRFVSLVMFPMTTSLLFNEVIRSNWIFY